MGAMDLLKSAGNTIAENIGIVEKAIVEIVDSRGAVPEPGQPPKPPAAGGGSLGGSFLSDSGAMGSLVSTELNPLKGMSSLADFASNANIKRYTVQFNPSSISLRGRGQGFMPVLSYGSEGSTITPAKQSVRITFSVKLVVDQVDKFDAFTEDKLNLSPTQLTQNVLKKGFGVNNKEASVVEIVEGFIAALRSPYTRIVTFHWGKMNYAGVLNNVAAQYVMFNRKGQPVRAYINLSLMLMENSPYPNNLGAWEEAYKAAFGVSSELRSAGAAQKLGGILNLG